MLEFKSLFKEMLSNKIRLALTILSVAWGTFSIAFMLSIGEGLRHTFGESVKSMGTQVLIVNGGQRESSASGQKQIELRPADFNSLQVVLKSLAHVSASSSWDVILFDKKQMIASNILPVEKNFFTLSGLSLRENGRFFNENDIQNAKQVIILGAHTVKTLFPHDENPIGKSININHYLFKIIGVQKKSLQLVNTSQKPDEYSNWIPMSTYQILTGKRNYARFYLAPFALNDVNKVEAILYQTIASNHRIKNEKSILSIVNLEERKAKMLGFLKGLEIVLGFLGGMTLLVASIGVANVMIMSVKSSTRMIGIRKSLGATTQHILQYYLFEACVISFIGGVLGLILTKSVLFSIEQIPLNSTLLQFFGHPKPYLSMSVLFIIIVVLSIMGLLSGIYPALKAAAINPAESLRNE